MTPVQNKTIGLIRRAQQSALFGVPGELERAHDPYFAREPYDMSLPGAVSEVKRALLVLAEAGAHPAGGGDPIVETTWKSIAIDDTWDLATAEEFMLFLSRHDCQAADALRVQDAAIPGTGPQPAVMGLECLAAVVNSKLQGGPKLKVYEAWRGGLFAPPSWVSAPPSDTPVYQTANVTPRDAGVPKDAPEANRQVLAQIDFDRFKVYRAMVDATTEAQRTALAAQASSLNAQRAAALAAARATSPSVVTTCGGTVDPTTGQCVVGGQAVAVQPPASSSTGLWIAAGIGLAVVGAAALYSARKR